MSRVVAFIHLTLDGVMQAPARPDEDRGGGFEHGGWAQPYFDSVMAAAWLLSADGARLALDARAWVAAYNYYGYGYYAYGLVKNRGQRLMFWRNRKPKPKVNAEAAVN